MNTSLHRIEDVKLKGSRVRARREELDLSQAQLAARAGISQGQLSKIEQGKVPDNLSGTIESLASALRVSVAYLCGVTEKAPEAEKTLDAGGGPGVSVPRMGTAYTAEESPVEDALLWEFDRARHSIADALAVRAALREIPAELRPADMRPLTRRLLDAAWTLRGMNLAPTPSAMLAVVARAAEPPA